MDLTPILVAAVPSILTALVTVVVATRLGIGPLNSEVRDQRQALVATLKDRVSILEEENAKLKAENEELKERVGRLETTLLELAVEKLKEK